MVDIGNAMSILTTVISFLQGIAEQVVPLVHKFLDKRSNATPQPVVNPYCQPPYCGDPPYHCANGQLSPQCFQRNRIDDTKAPPRTTMSSKINDDDNESKDKSSSSMSPGSTIMLVFILVIALAIIGFLYIRFNRKDDNRQINDGRKSSTWSL